MNSDLFDPYAIDFSVPQTQFDARMSAVQAASTSGGDVGRFAGDDTYNDLSYNYLAGDPSSDVALHTLGLGAADHIPPPHSPCGVSSLRPETVTVIRALFENLSSPSEVPLTVWHELRRVCDHAIGHYNAFAAAFPSQTPTNPFAGFNLHANTVYAQPAPVDHLAPPQHASHSLPSPTDYPTPVTRAPSESPEKPPPTPSPDASGSHTMHCQWDGCTMAFAATTNNTILVHLEQFHFVNLEEPYDRADRKRRTRCAWNGCRERRPLYLHSMPRHIATQHLGTMAAECARCGQVFTRSDARNRHIANVCGREEAAA